MAVPLHGEHGAGRQEALYIPVSAFVQAFYTAPTRHTRPPIVYAQSKTEALFLTAGDAMMIGLRAHRDGFAKAFRRCSHLLELTLIEIHACCTRPLPDYEARFHYDFKVCLGLGNGIES